MIRGLAAEVRKGLVLLEIAIADLASNPDTTTEQLERLREKLDEIRRFIIDAVGRK